ASPPRQPPFPYTTLFRSSKALFGALRLDASYFERTMGNFADDDLLLNTGVSFPVAFRRAEIRGTEVKLEVPHWKSASGSISYARSEEHTSELQSPDHLVC